MGQKWVHLILNGRKKLYFAYQRLTFPIKNRNIWVNHKDVYFLARRFLKNRDEKYEMCQRFSNCRTESEQPNLHLPCLNPLWKAKWLEYTGWANKNKQISKCRHFKGLLCFFWAFSISSVLTWGDWVEKWGGLKDVLIWVNPVKNRVNSS